MQPQPTNHVTLTLGELLAHNDSTIQRNAMSILKRLMSIATPKRQPPQTKK